MKPKQLYYLLIGLIIFFSLLGIAVFIFGQQLLGQKIQKIQTLSGDIQIETEQISRLQNLQDDYQEILPLAERAQSILPSQKQQAEVVAQVSAVVGQSGMPLNGLTFETTNGLPNSTSQTLPGKVAGILTMPVKFETTGTYQQLQTLLKNFENQERYMQVSALEITRTEDSKNLNINISLEVFLKP